MFDRCFNILYYERNKYDVMHLEFAVTYMCNSRCKHCNIWKIYKTNPKLLENELKLNEISDVFTNSRYLRRLYSIGITGGEPFLRKDIVDLLGFFVELYPQIRLNIVTNGVSPKLIEKRLRNFIKNYRFAIENLSITISLDGIGKIHDKIRGIQGNYENVLKTIHHIKNLGIDKISLSFTITPQNYHQLMPVYELSKRMGVGLGVQFAQTSAIYYGNNTDKNFKFASDTLKYLNKIIRKIEAERCLHPIHRIENPDTYYLLSMIDFQEKPANVFKRYECYAGSHICFIDPYGNVYPCIMLDKKLGNVREEFFDEIWTSKKAQSVRSFIKNKRCMCWTPCMTIPSIYLNPKTIIWNISKILKGS